MIGTILVLQAIWSLGRGSGVPHLAPVGAAPVVTAASSQYFERLFNRLVVQPPVLEPVIPVAPAPPVIVQPVTRTVPAVAVNPTPNVPVEPNIAIAIATAHAAAPVATILLPPYPFGPPPTIGFIPPAPPVVIPDEEPKKESTTKPTTKVSVTTLREPESTTPLPSPSNTANSFAHASPSNVNVNYKTYGPPLPLPLPAAKPQKLRTFVEIVPVPLVYIAPPPIQSQTRPIKYVQAFMPSTPKIIIRHVPASLRIRTVRVPARLVRYRTPISSRNVVLRNPQNVLRQRPINREPEPTTFRPFNRPVTKPPRL